MVSLQLQTMLLTKPVSIKMKDNFSAHAQAYAKYRPSYPPELFTYIRSICTGFETAWDCATGNGQLAKHLADMFAQVHATDISQQQLDHAVLQPNIHYSIQPAEQTNFVANSFDLVTVAQAVHWFNFEKFYAEVKRTAKQDGIIAIIGYGRFLCSPEIDRWVDELYDNIIGSYWDSERKYIDENYQTIPFPFKELPAPIINIEHDWTLQELVGYLETWSAVQKYTRQQGESPVRLIEEQLKKYWGKAAKRTITFPLLLRAGSIQGD